MFSDVCLCFCFYSEHVKYINLNRFLRKVVPLTYYYSFLNRLK